jgi:DNA-binding NtrC family response regulator
VWSASGRVRLGRDKTADVVLHDARASRVHAALDRVRGALALADLGSRHGTFVNGVQLRDETVTLAPGDVVRCGDTLLLVVEDVKAYEAPRSRIAPSFLGQSREIVSGPALLGIWQKATHVAGLSDPLLILGESGSGKELVARFLHATSGRGPFVPINATAIPETLFESELFGHERGAFTGAWKQKLGAFREAHGGVLFLDEIGDLSLSAQVKLLRALDQRAVRPLGSHEDHAVDVRIVTATSRNLREDSERGAFRQDLYYRLSGIVIEVPPLRERREDILELALGALADKPELSLSADAAEALLMADWPGNVRQLLHALTQGVVNALSRQATTLWPEDFALPAPSAAALARKPRGPRLLGTEELKRALEQADGNASVAARLLGVSRGTLYNACVRENLQLSDLRAELARPHDGEGAAQR